MTKHISSTNASANGQYDSEVLPSSLEQQEGDDEAGEEDLDQWIQNLLAAREKAFKEVEANIQTAQKEPERNL